VLHADRCKCRTQKSRQKSLSGHHTTILSGYIFATKAYIDNRKKNLLSSNISSTCLHNTVNFSPLAAEIVSLVWGTPGNFKGFRVLAALLHGTLVVGVSQTVAFNRGRHLYSAGIHHVGHWPTFLVCLYFCLFLANRNVSSLYAVARPSVCCLSVCNTDAPYSGGCQFLQFFYGIWYLDIHRKFYGDRHDRQLAFFE